MSSTAAFQSDMFATKIEQMLVELDRLILQSGNVPFTLLPPQHDIILVIRQIPLLINQSSTPLLLYSVVERVVCQLYRSTTHLAIEVYCRFLQILLELSASVTKDTLSWILYSEDPRKYNARITASLIKLGLVPVEDYDVQLSKQLESTNQVLLVEYSAELLNHCLFNSHPMTSVDDHLLTIKALTKTNFEIAKELIQHLNVQWTERYRAVNPNGDTFELRLLLSEWVRLYRHPLTTKNVYDQLAKRILDTVTTDSDRQCFFFRFCTEICVELYRPNRTHYVDAYSKLVGTMVEQTEGSIQMTSQILSVMVLVMAQHQDRLGPEFNQKPFLKLMSSLFIELNNVNEDKEGFISVYGNVLYTLQPLYFPGFSYSWLQLFSHRLFLPLLLKQEKEGWVICYKLTVALLSFLKLLLLPMDDAKKLSRSTKTFYQGTLRFLVVMLHDYPEFLCEHYLSLIDLLPLGCIQLRNVILSAFPRTMILPDPFMISLGYVASNATEPKLLQIEEEEEDSPLRTYGEYLLSKPTKISIGSSVVDYITLPDQQLSVERIQRLVFYIGSHSPLDTQKPLSENPAIQIYKYLLGHFSTVQSSFGPHVLLNSMTDHLRYPNRHTYFFSTALLHLFNSQPDPIKEQITRKIDCKSTPSLGLLTTFVQLIKETNFRENEFITSSPDINRLFDNVSR
ncbi:CCR4-Not complex component, Not1-domain-containing protein [Sporodiniella umbellata]|nr:CCR4-Not complex component, Not1-domain-containing protein [Sporodiniella umbellata]